MAIEMGRKYRTADGREVRLYAIEEKGLRPVHGAILHNNVWVSHSWTCDGKDTPDAHCDIDLIEIKPSAIDQMIEIMEDHKVSYQNSRANGLAHSVDLLITEARRLKAEAEREG